MYNLNVVSIMLHYVGQYNIIIDNHIIKIHIISLMINHSNTNGFTHSILPGTSTQKKSHSSAQSVEKVSAKHVH